MKTKKNFLFFSKSWSQQKSLRLLNRQKWFALFSFSFPLVWPSTLVSSQIVPTEEKEIISNGPINQTPTSRYFWGSYFSILFFSVLSSSHHYPSMAGGFTVSQSLLILAYLHSSQLLHLRLSLIADNVFIVCSVSCEVEYSDPSVKSESLIISATFHSTQRNVCTNSIFLLTSLSDQMR